jgi:hypothetical protein
MDPRVAGVVLVGLLVGLSVSCGGGSHAGSGDSGPADASSDVASDDAGDAATPDAPAETAPPPQGYPATHAAPPIVETFGGPILAAPKVVPIFFANDADQSQLEAFLMQLAASPYWKTTTGEYGVGPLSVAPSIVVTDAAPAMTTSLDILAWLAGYVGSGMAGWPAADPNNVYTVFYPQSTTITDGTSTSCQDYGAYHDEGNSDADAGAPPFPVAVIPRCANFNGLGGIDVVTANTSHELVEAATSPRLRSAPAFHTTDDDHIVWTVVPGGETGDMCIYDSRAYEKLVGTFMVQRTWSNASAQAGLDPCVPGVAGPYINAAPDLDDAVTLDRSATAHFRTTGVTVPTGMSKTIAVRLFSTAPANDWTVEAHDVGYESGGPATLSFKWDKSSGHNGDVLHLTITRTADGSIGGTELMLVSNVSATEQTVWFGFVAN